MSSAGTDLSEFISPLHTTARLQQHVFIAKGLSDLSTIRSVLLFKRGNIQCYLFIYL